MFIEKAAACPNLLVLLVRIDSVRFGYEHAAQNRSRTERMWREHISREGLFDGLFNSAL